MSGIFYMLKTTCPPMDISSICQQISSDNQNLYYLFRISSKLSEVPIIALINFKKLTVAVNVTVKHSIYEKFKTEVD